MSGTRKYQICTNCIMDTSDPQITFDKHGECDFCLSFKKNIAPSWHTDERGHKELMKIAQKIKEDTKGKKYNCILVSAEGWTAHI